MTKPFSPRELRARIKALLRRTAQELPETYRFGEVEVDFARRELRLRGKPVEITLQEFKLLAAFIHHRGRVLTRDQILDEAWGSETYGLTLQIAWLTITLPICGKKLSRFLLNLVFWSASAVSAIGLMVELSTSQRA